jgi:hypothetical protein
MIYSAVKGLLVAALKFFFVLLSWLLKIVALLATQISLVIEKIVNKRL